MRSQIQLRAMRRKSLYKSTENEEAGKVQSCADVQRNTHNICINVQKIRKLIEKNAQKCVKNARKCVIFNQ